MKQFAPKMSKRVLPLLFCGALLASPCVAQTDAPPPPPTPDQAGPPPAGYGGGPRRGGPDHRAEMLARQLDLTPDQTAQVKVLMESEHSKMAALHSNNALSQDEMRSQMMAVHQESETKLRAMLTPDQVTKLDAMQARMREHRQEGQGAPPPPQQ